MIEYGWRVIDGWGEWGDDLYGVSKCFGEALAQDGELVAPHPDATARTTIHHRDDPSIAAGIPVAAAGPTNASTAIRSYRHGEWESISSTILLPRKGARMGALARVLVPSQPGERRAMTVFYRPVSQQAAGRATGRAQMSAVMAERSPTES